jgi:hypothetical protein
MRTIAAAFLGLAVLLAGGQALAQEYLCHPKEVAVHDNRVAVWCTIPATDGSATINYFAVPTSDATYANRFLEVSNLALISGRNLNFIFTAGDTSGTAFGCAANNCRSASGVNLR